MTDRGQAVAVAIVFVGLAIIAIGGVYVFNAAYEDVATDTKTITNETTTDTRGLVQLNESGKTTVIYYAADNVTVYNASGAEMSQPADYEWNRLNGTIAVNSSGDLSGDANLSATYGYNVGSEQAQAVLQLTGPQRTVLKLLIWAVAVALVAVAMRVFMS